MATHWIHPSIPLAARTALLALLLSGCGKSPAPEEPPPPPAAPAAPADTPPAAPAPDGEVPPADAAEPAPSPTPQPPPPTEPSAVPKPTAANEPRVESMLNATPSAKISVPVDLRYQFDGEVLPNQPVTLHLAALPRVAGARLRMSVKPVAGLEVSAGPLEVQKVSAASTYRQQLSVTRIGTEPQNMRVLVTMDMPEGTAFGFFTIPLVATKDAHQKGSIKQR